MTTLTVEMFEKLWADLMPKFYYILDKNLPAAGQVYKMLPVATHEDHDIFLIHPDDADKVLPKLRLEGYAVIDQREVWAKVTPEEQLAKLQEQARENVQRLLQEEINKTVEQTYSSIFWRWGV